MPIVPLLPRSEHLTLGNPSGATADTHAPIQLPAAQTRVRAQLPPRPGQAQLGELAPDARPTGAAPTVRTISGPTTTLPAGWYRVTGHQLLGLGLRPGPQLPLRRPHQPPRPELGHLPDDQHDSPGPQPQPADLGQPRELTAAPSWRRRQRGVHHHGLLRQGRHRRQRLSATLDQGRVTVPARVWKVVVVLPAGDNDAARVSAATRVIAVDTPNDNTISTDWSQLPHQRRRHRSRHRPRPALGRSPSACSR